MILNEQREAVSRIRSSSSEDLLIWEQEVLNVRGLTFKMVLQILDGSASILG
jgi:hypothetical protein